MNHNCYVKRYPSPEFIANSYDVLTSEKVLCDGRVISRSKYVLDVPSERYPDWNPDDWYLENLIANGVELKEVRMDSSSLLATAHVVNRLASLSDLQKSLNNE